MITPTTQALLRLSLIKGVGPARQKKALRTARQLGEPLAELVERDALGEVLSGEQRALAADTVAPVARLVDELAELGVAVVSIADDAYPRSLVARLRDAAPPLLMVRGDLRLLELPSVGFCGSRAASERGLAVANDCADQLARAGLVITSGYAAGVDMATHRAALRAGGATTIVLAEGIAGFRVKRDLAEELDPARVCVVSEFAAHAAWSAGNAMQRNHTIVGLSHAMILIEARATGGSIAAGRAALSLGVPLFAPVYDGMPETATGNRELLAHGARGLLRSGRTGRANLEPVLEALRPDGHASAAAGQLSLLG